MATIVSNDTNERVELRLLLRSLAESAKTDYLKTIHGWESPDVKLQRSKALEAEVSYLTEKRNNLGLPTPKQ